MVGTKDRGLLLYIISHCKRIEEKTNGLTKEQFYKNIDIQEIVCFNIFQIGELAKNLSLEFIISHNKIPWKNIKGMRDRIGHGYGTIKLEDVWNTAINDITPLKDFCLLITK